MSDGIFALCSAPGRAGVAVVRLSGPGVGEAVQALGGPLPAPRQAVLRRLAYGGAGIDRALLVWFPAPASFTGEDVAELHVHGGRAIREALDRPLSPQFVDRPLDEALRWITKQLDVPTHIDRHTLIDEAIALDTLGPQLERHPMFPERANIEVAQITGDNAIRLRVWERGAGITLACGTGACATLVAAARRGLTGRKADVTLDGGTLTIEWLPDNHVLMTGPTAMPFRGYVDINRL